MCQFLIFQMYHWYFVCGCDCSVYCLFFVFHFFVWMVFFCWIYYVLCVFLMAMYATIQFLKRDNTVIVLYWIVLFLQVCVCVCIIVMNTYILTCVESTSRKSDCTWHQLWPSHPKWVALLLVHFLGTATFPKGVPCIDFGFSTKSVSPVFSTSKQYTCYTHNKCISHYKCNIMCLKQATLQ